MHHPSGGVLVLYNAPRPSPGNCAESDAGIVAEAEAVGAALAALGVPHRLAAVHRVEEVSAAVAAGEEDAVVNLVESLPGDIDDAVSIPGICRSLGKACTGGDTDCLALTLDKAWTKAVLRAAGVPTPDGVATDAASLADRPLPPFPVIVKPIRADASEGITAASVVVAPGARLRRAVERIEREFGQPALVERYIEGREINVSIVEREAGPLVLPIAEIDFSAYPDGLPRIVDYPSKWVPDSFEYRNTPRIVPADLPEPVAAAILNVSLAAWHVTRCRDYARIDLRLHDDGTPYVLEVNVNPDVGPDSGFSATLRAAGIGMPEFVASIVANARARRRRWTAAAMPSPGSTPAPGIRRVAPADRGVVIAILDSTGAFRPDEIRVAAEVLDEALAGGADGHYQAFVCEEGGRVVGWVCYGPTPCTADTYDIYWIAVDVAAGCRGHGTRLMKHAETSIGTRGGRLIVVETAGRPRYDGTRAFYERLGYRETARIPDFYAPGDAKIVYTKPLPAAESVSAAQRFDASTAIPIRG